MIQVEIDEMFFRAVQCIMSAPRYVEFDEVFLRAVQCIMSAPMYVDIDEVFYRAVQCIMSALRYVEFDEVIFRVVQCIMSAPRYVEFDEVFFRAVQCIMSAPMYVDIDEVFYRAVQCIMSAQRYVEFDEVFFRVVQCIMMALRYVEFDEVFFRAVQCIMSAPIYVDIDEVFYRAVQCIMSALRYVEFDEVFFRVVQCIMRALRYVEFDEVFFRAVQCIMSAPIYVDIDEVFYRAVQCIMSAPRLGTWQFLADMPYSCLSSYMVWKLLWFLHHSDKGEVCSSTSINVKTRARLDEYKWDLSDSTKIANFGNRLLNMPMSEVIYLLTTFANMASARSNKEPDFVITITNEVYELAYVNKYTRDSCSKVGRELLASVALTHPFIITNIFSLIQSSMDVIGSMSVYLCSELPVHLWKPSVSDMSLLRGWILDHSPDSTKNQLARLILSKLDWGYTEQEDELVLDISLHRKVAILVMEAFTKHIAEKSQGAFIASTISWGISVVLGDVVNLDVWCWDLLNKLRLHSQDQPTSIPSASGGYHSKTSEARGTSLSSERDFAPPDLNGDPTLYPVNKALSSKIPLACYIAVAMTKAGHDLEEFLTKGLEYLQNLISAGCYRMCIPLIGKIVPTFIASGCQEYLLQSIKFVSLIEAILTADHQYSRILEKLSLSFQRECTHLFSSMIAKNVRNPRASGLLSSVMSLVSSSSPLPTMTEQYKKEFPWLAYSLMLAETRFLQENGVLQIISQELHANANLTNDQALKYRNTSTHVLNHLHQYENPKPEPAVKAFIAPIREIPDNVLVDHQAMLQLIEGDLQEMLNYANSFSTRESLNVALDLSYIELMPTLYHNSEVETRLEIPCRSAVSSRHRCLGPAKIVVRHQECKLSDAVKRKLDENRTEYKQLSIEMESPPPPIICTAAVHIENAITDLINKSRSSTGEEKMTHNQVGVALLYHLANKMNDDCRHYPPTRQFFTSCIEILGQEFVRPYPEQAQPLLLEILTNHQLAGVLAPNFVPCNCPSSFVHMYTEVVRATVKNMQDLAFMLLTKFDIAYWLEQYHPTHSTCSQLITIITEALVACGGRQDSDSIPLPHYEVYRSHLQTVFLYNFPQHYSFVIHIVMKGMEEKNLKLKILEDILKTLNCHILPQFGDIGPKQIEKLVQEETLLSVGELEESVVWMGNYFSNQRHSKQDLLRFGLYSHWKDYMPTLSSFLGYLALNFVLKEAKRLQETDGNIEQGIRKLWELVLSLFAPWVGSAEAASSTRPGQFDVVPAWMEGDVDSALVMVTLFIETTSFIQALFHNAQHPANSNVLSLFWSYYVRCMVKKGVREDILYTYHRAMTSLPWTEFIPDVYCMQSMVKMYEEGQESCVLFLASIFHRIQWTGILECIIARGDIQTANLFLSALLSMLIIFSNSPPIMQSQGRNIKVVIAGAHELQWYLIDESCYHSATMWQLRKCNPRFVLEEYSVGSILKLMRAVGGVESKEPPNLRLASKQASYIGLVVGLMCQCSQNREIRAEEFTNPLHGLLYDITIISSSAGPRVDSSSHLCSLLTTVLSLLNGCSPITGAPDAILRGLTSWLATCADDNLVLQIISVACNSLASTKHMAVIIESCIDSYFATVKPPPNDRTHGWASIVSVLQIPQLSHDEFLLQCLEAGSYLTLYAYLAQKLPQCRSLEEETAINTRLLEWCINCKPSGDNEYKLLLWWYKAIELSVRMINFGAPESNVCRSLNNLAPAILTLGEDRKSSGILGALGFGRHSQLSLR
nr:ectopic P granules protein 5 homolog [Lytechinus pictus]